MRLLIDALIARIGGLFRQKVVQMNVFSPASGPGYKEQGVSASLRWPLFRSADFRLFETRTIGRAQM